MTPPVYQYIDLDYLEKMASGDRTTKKLMLEMIVEELQSDIPQMVRFYEQKQWDQLHGACHKMKTTFALTGNKEMIKANNIILAQLVGNGNPKALDRELELLKNSTAKVIRELKAEHARIQ